MHVEDVNRKVFFLIFMGAELCQGQEISILGIQVFVDGVSETVAIILAYQGQESILLNDIIIYVKEKWILTEGACSVEFSALNCQGTSSFILFLLILRSNDAHFDWFFIDYMF